MSAITDLANEMLDEKELKLADHLALLLADDRFDSGSFILTTIPMYWETVGDRSRSLEPDPIYRPLYYVHGYGGTRNFEEKTRVFIDNVSAHIEGCLLYLTPSPPRFRAPTRPFGGLVAQLKESGILSDELAGDLWKFNEVANVPSKHFGAYTPTPWLDERTFSIKEAAYAFVMMRKLAIQLFALLKTNGADLPHYWPEFKEDWLVLSPLIEERPSRLPR